MITKHTPGKAPARILELLQGGPRTREEISQSLSIPVKLVSVRLTELKDLEYVDKELCGRVPRFKTAVHRWKLRA